MNRREVLRGAGIAAAAAAAAGAAQQTLRLRAFDAAGAPAAPNFLGSLLLTDTSGKPFELLPKTEGPGAVSIGVPDGAFEATMILPVRGFGQVYLYAAGIQAGEHLLNYEFARSRAAFVRRYVKAAQGEGVAFGKETLGRLERGEAALARAAAAPEEGQRVGHANDSLAETMWAGEMAALERARHRIARRGPRPGFLFGANGFRFAGPPEYGRRFTELMNFATVPFYRAGAEPTEGSPDYSRADAVLAKTAGAPLLLKGHPLVWFHRAGIPAFLKSKSWGELQRSCRDYILRSVGRYRTRIHAWDVINEAHDWANDLNLDRDQLIDITRLAAESTREADPTAFRVVNSCSTWAEYVARRRTYSGPLGRASRTPLEYYRALEDARVPYEAIGLQVYYPSRDMLEIERNLERFFAFGKPVHITELGVSSSSEPAATGEGRLPNRNVWHGAEWTEKIQADWVEQFYTICYSLPQIEAITWWDFADPAFIPHGGLLRADMQPKEACQRLSALVAAWRKE